MKKRILSFALTLAMLLSMTTVAFAANWETPIDVVKVAEVGDEGFATLEDAFAAAAGEQVSLTADSFDSTAPGAQLDLKVLLDVDGVDAEAVADQAFLAKWAASYKANSSIYITAKIVDTEGKTVVASPAIGANGVNISGTAM